MEDILSRLEVLDRANGTPEQFRSLLRDFLNEAARR
jgi:hypothetical protein